MKAARFSALIAWIALTAIGSTAAATIALPAHFRALGDRIYFAGQAPGLGQELYVTDAALQSASRLIDLAPGETSSHPAAVGWLGERLLVETFDQDRGALLWSVDPSRGARTLLATLRGPSPPYMPVTRPLLTTNGHVLFSVSGNGWYSIWASDGTTSGTQRLVENVIATCAAPARATGLRASGTRHAVWSSAGTLATTQQAFTTTTDTVRAFAGRYGNHCYYLFARSEGWEIWRTDGTPNGSNLVAQNATGMPRGFAVVGSVAYVLDSITSSFRLWRSDALQPVAVHDGWFPQDSNVQVVGSHIAYSAPYTVGAFEDIALFVSDGTAAGTRRIGHGPAGVGEIHCPHTLGQRLVATDWQNTWNIDPAAATWGVSPTPSDLACSGISLNGVIVGEAPSNGGDAWRSDATAAGTYPLSDATDRIFVFAFEP